MFVNTTPHDIVVYDAAGENIIKTIPKSDFQIRLRSTQQEPQRIIDGIPIYSNQRFLGLEFLGTGSRTELVLDDGKMYIVSLVVQSYVCQHIFDSIIRKKIFAVGSGSFAVRNKEGQVIGTTMLSN